MSQHTHLYNCTRWRKLRAAQLSKEPLCKMCAEQDDVEPATVADHVKPHNGDLKLFWYGELQSLCAMCHSSIKQSEEKTGQATGCDANGLPLDGKHFWNT